MRWGTSRNHRSWSLVMLARRGLRWLVEPSERVTDPDERHHAQLLAAVLVGLIVMAIVLGVVSEFTSKDAGPDTSDLLVTLGTFAALLGLYELSRSIYHRLAALLTVAVMTLAIFMAAIPTGDPQDANLLVYLVLPVLLGSAVLSGRAGIALIVLEMSGLLVYQVSFPGTTLDEMWMGYVVTTSTLIVLTVRYLRVLEHNRREALTVSEARYRVLFEGIDDVVFVHDIEGRILEVNEVACTRLGYTREELLSMNTSDLDSPDYAAGSADRIARQLAEGSLRIVGGVHVTRSGQRIDIDSNTRVIVYKGRPAILAVCRDISERARVESVLAESESRTQALLSAFPDSIFRMSADGVFLDYQAGETTSLYLTPDQFFGKHIAEVFPPEIAQATLQRIRKALQTNGLQASEYQLPGGDGPHYYEARSVPVSADEVLTVVRDVTERKQAEEALRRSEANQRALLNAIPDLIFRISRDGVFQDYNPTASDSYLVPELFLGKSIREVLPDLAEETLAKMELAFATGKPQTMHYQMQLNGEQCDYEARISPRPDDEAVIIVRDVTETVRAQARLRISESEYRSLFENSPISMWEEDFSAVRQVIESLLASGVNDVGEYLETHLATVQECAALVRVVNTNHASLKLYEADSLEALMHGLPAIFSETAADQFRQEIAAFAAGAQHFQTEAPQITLAGNTIEVLLTASIAPGCDETWRKVFVSLVDITALKQTERALRESEALYRELFEGIDDVITVHDFTGRILDVNGAACRRLGYTRDELLRMKTIDLDAPEYAAGFEARLAIQNTVGHLSNITGTHIAKDGRRIAIDVNTTLITYKGQPAVLGVVRDITERLRVEQAERELRTLAEALRDVAAAINNTLVSDEVFDRLLTSLGRVVPYETASIAVLKGRSAPIVRSAGFGSLGLGEMIMNLRLDIDTHSNLRRMEATRQPVLIGDIQQDEDWIPVEDSSLMRSYLGAPICREDEVIGFIHLQSTQTDFFTSEHAERLQMFADQAAIALRNARLYNEVQQHAADLEVLHQISLDMMSQLDSDALLTALTQDMIRLLGVDAGGVYLYRPMRNVIERVVSVGKNSTPVGAVLKRGEGLSGKVWDQDKPLIIADYTHWDGRSHQYDAYVDSGVEVVGVAIRWREQFLGVLNVRSDLPSRHFSEADVRLLSLFATQAAVAIKNAQLYDEVQQHVAELEALRRLTLDISAQLDLDSLLHALIESALSLLGVDSGGVYLYRPAEDALEWAVTVGPDVAPSGVRLHRGEGLSGRVWEHGQPMIQNDYAHWPGRADVYEGLTWSAVIAVPIHGRGELLGVINAVADARQRAFSQHDADLLSLFANQAAIAIQNAKLFAAEREQRVLSDALRDTAAVINSTLELDQVLDRILSNIDRVVPHDAANVMLIEGDMIGMVGSRGYGQFGPDEWTRTHRFHLTARPETRKLVETGQGYIISDTHGDPDWVRFQPTSWIRSHIATPIRAEGNVIGVLNLDHAQPGAFTLANLEALGAFTDQAATAIHNARLYAEVRRHTDDLERYVAERTSDLSVRNAVAETLSSSLDTSEMLNGVLQTAVAQLGVLGGAIYLLADDGRSLDMVAHSGVSPETLQQVTGILPGISNFGRFETGDYPPAEPPSDITASTGISAALSVPIWRQEQVQGVIALVHDQPRPWRADEARMLDAIGRQIGVALANARLYADAVRDEARLRTILQSVADGLLVFDRDGSLILMNRAAEDLFAFYPVSGGGAPRAALRLWEWLQSQNSENIEFTLPVAPLLAENRGSSISEPCLAQGCAQRSSDDPSWPCWLCSGGPSFDDLRVCTVFQRIPKRSIQAQSAHVRGPDGDIQGTVIILHDVTYFRDLDELKGRFVSTVSHELRTPLSAVLLQVSTLLKYYDRFTETDRRGMIQDVQQQAYVLRELIEDILELSRFDARRAMPQKQWFDLAEQCREVVDALTLAFEEKKLVLDAHGINEPRYILGDPNQLTRVMRNLVSNAAKYTPDGGHVTLHMDERDAQIHLTVTDTGIGIAPDKQVYIFDRFFRTEEASQMASGTGLGLSITKEIVDLHGGHIDLQSVIGQGSTFTVILPVTDTGYGGESSS